MVGKILVLLLTTGLLTTRHRTSWWQLRMKFEYVLNLKTAKQIGLDDSTERAGAGRQSSQMTDFKQPEDMTRAKAQRAPREQNFETNPNDQKAERVSVMSVNGRWISSLI